MLSSMPTARMAGPAGPSSRSAEVTTLTSSSPTKSQPSTPKPSSAAASSSSSSSGAESPRASSNASKFTEPPAKRFTFNPSDLLLPHERAAQQALKTSKPSQGFGHGVAGPSQQQAYGPGVGSTAQRFGPSPQAPIASSSQSTSSQRHAYPGGLGAPSSSSSSSSPRPSRPAQPSQSGHAEAWRSPAGTAPPSLSDVRIPNWNAGLDAKNGSASSSSVSLQSRAKQRPEEASVDPLRTPTQHGGQAETDSQIDPLDEVAAVGRDLEDVDMDSGSPVAREATRMPSKLSEFELVETLGCGTFGRVCLVRVRPPWRSTSYHPIFPRGQPHVDPLEPSPAETARADMERPHYAMKILAKSEIVRLKQVEHINNELSILKAVRHPFLIELYAAYQDNLNVYLLMSVVPGGELFTIIRRLGHLAVDVARFYAANVVLAIAYLHSHDIAYRDIKPENLLLGTDGYLKICDFGFAKRLDNHVSYTLCGTPDYLAPEIILNKAHSVAVDWWATGVLTYEMLVGYPPFFADSPMATYERILDAKTVFPSHVDPYAKSFIRGLLTPDLSCRLGNLAGGAKDVMEHTFFAGVDWDILEQRKIPPPIIPSVTSKGDARNFQRYPPPRPSEFPGIFGQTSSQDPYAHLFQAFNFPLRS